MTFAASTPSRAGRLWLLGEQALAWLEHLRPLALLAARLYVAHVFLASGLTKLHDWDTTLALFMDEYHVPLLNPTLAAYMGTGGELGLSVLLALGLFGRFAAAGLSVLNGVAVISLMSVPDAALMGHVYWGSLLIAVLLLGPGAISVDRFLIPRLRERLLGARAGAAASEAPALRRMSRL